VTRNQRQNAAPNMLTRRQRLDNARPNNSNNNVNVNQNRNQNRNNNANTSISGRVRSRRTSEAPPIEPVRRSTGNIRRDRHRDFVENLGNRYGVMNTPNLDR